MPTKEHGSSDDGPLLPGGLISTLLLGALLLTGVPGCSSSPDRSSTERPVVEVAASDSSLSLRDSVSSGWVTFRMTNEGRAHHSFKMKRLPAGVTFEHYRRSLLAPFDSLQAALVGGRIDTATYRSQMRDHLPDWYGESTTVGGITGLAPGHTAEITHDLAPGQYALLCFFRTPEQRTHAFLGVRAGLTVTEDSSTAAPPTADVTARLSHDEFDVDPGRLSDEQTLRFESVASDGEDHSPVVGLFRLTSDTGVDEIRAWMNDGIPLPAPTDWIGGPEPMPAGDVAYVPVGDLAPGRYAWVTLRARDTTGMTHTFTVTSR